MNTMDDFSTYCDETNIPTTVLGFLQSKEIKRKSVTRCRAFDSPRETSIQKQFHTQVKDLNTDELRQLLCDVVSVNGELQDTLQQNNEQLEKQLKVYTVLFIMILISLLNVYAFYFTKFSFIVIFPILGASAMEKSKK